MSSLRPTPAAPSTPTLGGAVQDVAALFGRCHARVFQAAYRVTGNVQDAEDVLQGVFLKLVRQPEAFRTMDLPEAYLYRAAVNAALDLVRTKGRRKVISLEGVASADLASPAETAGDDPGLPAVLRRAIAQLSPRAGEMFVLHYFEGYNHQEIADLFDTTANVVGVTLFRAREQLKTALGALQGKDLDA